MQKLSQIKIVEKPWGKEIWFGLTDDYLGKVIFINLNGKVSRHLHKEKEETLFVYSGEVKVNKNKTGRIYSPGQRIHISPGMEHSFEALAGNRVVLFEVSTPHPEDSVRIKDFYGRECDGNSA